MTAAELRNAKARALEFVDQGDPLAAFHALAGAILKGPPGEVPEVLRRGMRLLLSGELRKPAAMRRFIRALRLPPGSRAPAVDLPARAKRISKGDPHANT